MASSRASKKSYKKGSRKVSRKVSHKVSKKLKSRKASSKKASSRKASSSFYFMAWYHTKPKVTKRLSTSNASVKRDDDDEWMFSGNVKATSKAVVRAWLKSLGKVKRYADNGAERIDISL